uniref:Uncharacterized protein n=1 Tax=Myoviridae sp. ctXwe21 TaxID=2825123 RepID=A0A8S5PXS2_9CAUD|nr:MAG TPA: hypothetical protein [Myoviridae sp. ctXwe21]
MYVRRYVVVIRCRVVYQRHRYREDKGIYKRQ